MFGVTARTIGARRLSNASSVTSAQISAAAPQVLCAGSATTNRPVRCTERMMVSMSSGTSVRGSMTSTEMPSSASASAALTASGTALEIATTVTSDPWRSVRASPNGILYSSSGTSSFSPQSVQASKVSTGSSMSTAVRSSPFASAGEAAP